jgi:hypothetical protein
MAEVILSTESLTVLGGPATVDLEVDFGPEGDRGSYIFVGEGDPNSPSTVIGQDPAVFDLYINLDASDNENYLAMYQYQNVDGSNTWTKLLKLIPNTYSTNNTGTFVDGERLINIPVINVVPLDQVANISAANFNIQYNILNNNPVSSSLSVGELVSQDDIVILPLTIKALEYADGAWSNLSGQKTVHLFITVV